MPPAKKPAKSAAKKKRRAKKKPAAKKAAKGTVAGRRAEPDEVSGPAKGDIAKRMLRDTRIVARKVQGWTWEEIAHEAGLSVDGAKAAHKARKDGLQLTLRMDPVEVIENVAEGYSLSIGDLEAIAASAIEDGQLSNAIGAKKAANEGRGKLVELLQATGRLPQDLTALRHLIDLRTIGVKMLDSMDGFQREVVLINQIEDGEKRAAALQEASAKVRLTFDELLGIGSPAIADAEGTAVEVDPEPASAG